MRSVGKFLALLILAGSLAGCGTGDDPYGWGAGYHVPPHYGYGGGYYGRPYYGFGDGHPIRPYFKYTYGGGFFGGRKSGIYYGPPR